MSEFVSFAGLAVASASLFVAFLAFRRSSSTQRESNAIQQRVLAIEETRERERLDALKRAELRAELRQTASNSYRLYLVNEGAATARKVSVTLDGQEFSKHAAAVSGDGLGPTIGPMSEVSCILGLCFDCGPPFDIQVTWEDDSGEPRSYRSTLTF
jgi:hypothetical protein